MLPSEAGLSRAYVPLPVPPFWAWGFSDLPKILRALKGYAAYYFRVSFKTEMMLSVDRERAGTALCVMRTYVLRTYVVPTSTII